MEHYVIRLLQLLLNFDEILSCQFFKEERKSFCRASSANANNNLNLPLSIAWRSHLGSEPADNPIEETSNI